MLRAMGQKVIKYRLPNQVPQMRGRSLIERWAEPAEEQAGGRIEIKGMSSLGTLGFDAPHHFVALLLNRRLNGQSV